MPDAVVSNLNDFERYLSKISKIADLTEHELGRKILDTIARNAYDRAHEQRGADGEWAANRGDYGETKRFLGIPVGIGIADDGGPSGEMLRPGNFLNGPREIEPDQATAGFGNNEFDSRKGQWFNNGSARSEDGTESSGAKNQPPRDLFSIVEDEDSDAIIDLIAQAVSEDWNL